jgi:uncharacterized protein
MKLLIDNIELLPHENEESLGEMLRALFGMPEPFRYTIIRKSLDARNRSHIVYRYRVEADLPDGYAASIAGIPGVSPADESPKAPAPRLGGSRSVAVVGSGPAGLFCALRLAEAGASVTIFERGRRVDERLGDIMRLKSEGVLDAESNVLFGEGGAGTYSDGKLTTRIHRPEVEWFFSTMVELGAPPSILYEQRPHLGTDHLVPILKNMRGRLLAGGAVLRFGERVTGLVTREGRVAGVRTAAGDELPADAVVLATGHSARDTYLMLEKAGVALEKKGFAVGVRVEHPAELIDFIRYGDYALKKIIPPADYLLTARNERSGRGVYSFCMCPGGEVINSSSESGMLCTNGMSCSRRDGRFSNAGIVVQVGVDEIEGGPLAGIDFQRRIEESAFRAGGGGFIAPAQRMTDFIAGKRGVSLPESSYLPGLAYAPLVAFLPGWIAEDIAFGLKCFDRKMKGFIAHEGIIIGAETRTSSPVRITRGSDFQSVSHQGLYPAGEGAGYAGGIVSSAVDGIRVADGIVCALGAVS